MTDNTRGFWSDLVALNNRSEAKTRGLGAWSEERSEERDGEVARVYLETATEAREFLTGHRYLWPQIKADMARYVHDTWMSWNIALAICDATGCQHIEHVQRVGVLGDARCDGRERPPF